MRWLLPVKPGREKWKCPMSRLLACAESGGRRLQIGSDKNMTIPLQSRTWFQIPDHNAQLEVTSSRKI